MKRSLFSFLTCLPFIFSHLNAQPAQELDFLKTINAHLRIRDFTSANEEAVKALHLFPHSKALWQVYIRALARAGHEKDMISTWKSYTEVFPEEKDNRLLTEALAWGVIEHASNSSSPIIRMMALLSAFLSQDAKGIKILTKCLRDSNSAIRGSAVQLASNLRDDVLKDEIYYLFHHENVWNVRMESIRAIGQMKMREVQNELLDLLKNENTTAEERSLVVESLVNLWDRAERKDIEKLVKSNRAGLRLLACEVIAHFEMKNCMDLIFPLTDDHNADVRRLALWTIGYLRVNPIENPLIKDLIEKRLNDRDSSVAITAAWLTTLNEPQKGQKAFTKWLNHGDRDIRILAAAYLSACGKYAKPLIESSFKEAKDPYVRINLALGLLSQRLNIQEACFSLYEALQNVNEKWAWDEKYQVRVLVPSKIRYTDDLNNSPETVNQITRLEILNILAVMKFAKAQEAIRAFLQEKTWGITAMAAATLLTEGDENSLDLVKKLMNDPDSQVRTQAALILALWGGEKEVLENLTSSYNSSDRDLKERILEGMVRISAPESIPFLLERMDEPNQSLRVIAAAGLLLCLYH